LALAAGGVADYCEEPANEILFLYFYFLNVVCVRPRDLRNSKTHQQQHRIIKALRHDGHDDGLTERLVSIQTKKKGAAEFLFFNA